MYRIFLCNTYFNLLVRFLNRNHWCVLLELSLNCIFCVQNFPHSKVHGAIMGPIWGWQDPGGPHFGPMYFAIWELTVNTYSSPVKVQGLICVIHFTLMCCKHYHVKFDHFIMGFHCFCLFSNTQPIISGLKKIGQGGVSKTLMSS